MLQRVSSIHNQSAIFNYSFIVHVGVIGDDGHAIGGTNRGDQFLAGQKVTLQVDGLDEWIGKRDICP